MSADIFQWVSLIAGLVGTTATIILGTLAIVLSLYFYRRSNDLFVLMTSTLSQILGSTKATEIATTTVTQRVVEGLIAVWQQRIETVQEGTRLRAAETLGKTLTGAPPEQIHTAALEVAKEITSGFTAVKSSVAVSSPDYDWRFFIRTIRDLEKNNRFLSVKNLHQKKFADDVGMREALQVAIAQSVLTTYKLPNPNSPDYPTLCCKLNQDHPLVAHAKIS
ncbi:MAG: hypothetical protein HYZ72_12250 [Deltaproteobacteria bacterium]|nr:hypothetical protein [Deltaproteobacteria bacterium]